MSRTASRRATLLLLIVPLVAMAVRKPIRFSGLIESIDTKLQTVAVRHGDIPGYLPAMTMDYPVETSAQLRRLSPGDEIEAIVYVGDPVLHDVHVVGHRRAKD
jgi:Cu/Ag efflux protein CusF